MVIKQLEEGNFLFWCPACNDNHVIDGDYTVSGPEDAPTVTPSYYDWDDKGVCHVKIAKGKLYFLPDCSHELVEQTVPMCPIPGWMLSAEYVEPEAPRDTYYYPQDEDSEEEFEDQSEEIPEDITADDLADEMVGLKPRKYSARAA